MDIEEYCNQKAFKYYMITWVFAFILLFIAYIIDANTHYDIPISKEGYSISVEGETTREGGIVNDK